MYDLLKYILVGQRLPDTVEAYQYRLELDPLAFMWVFDDIDPLVEAYALIIADSSECRDHTYPTILDVAAQTLEYARDAAGIDGTSIYSRIFQLVRDLAHATRPDEVLILTQELDHLIGKQIDKVETLQMRSDICTEALKGLDEHMRRSQITVQQRSEAMHNLVAQALPNPGELEGMLSTLRSTVSEVTKKYEHEQLVACEAPTYEWLNLSGVLAASAIAVLRGRDATSTADLMDSVAAAIAADNVINKDGNSILADLKAVDTDLVSVLSESGSAINVIEQMMGSWTAISSDLSNLLDMIKDDIEGANQYIASLNEKKIISDWKDLADAVAKFQGAAQPEAHLRSFAPASISMNDLARQLRAQAGK
ncbi:uncharacterized protein SCHCODRAFT_01189599 [Schizophyllum commune H4-8]|nr:uncharacterized protein SCHCODRAFT_01189599 [Schizophyllum commune H4-8]KAI5892275.1 hypothetical protein SCHCODRAFT_01189599 [Schizophyllum commune H4-8]